MLKKMRWLMVVLGTIVLLGGVRWALHPKAHPLPGIGAAPTKVADRQKMEANLLSAESLAAALASKRIILVGEHHFLKEMTAYLTRLLALLGSSNLHLMLELPEKTQKSIDRYLSGDDSAFEAIWRTSGTLPYQDILRWARHNRSLVRRVAAIDENRIRIIFNRLLLTDTRNETMARNVLRVYRSDSSAKILVYGGQLHMTLAGRYRYDVPNREPIGSRILRAGVPRSDVASIMLSGSDRFHLSKVWKKPGALRVSGPLAQLPFPYFIDYPMFRVKTAGELFDYFVNLGKLSPRGR